jgi:hypothetical protein
MLWLSPARPPTGPRWWLLHQPDSRSAQKMRTGTTALLGEAPHQPPPPTQCRGTCPGGRTCKGSLLISHHPQSHNSLLQTSNPVGLDIHQSEDKVTDLQTSGFEMRAPLCSLPKPDDHLSYNTRLGSINGQAPEDGLSSQIDRHLERG